MTDRLCSEIRGHERLKKWDKVAEICLAAINNTDGSAPGYVYISYIKSLHKDGRLREALSVADEALSVYSDNLDMLTCRYMANIDSNQFASAIDDAERIIELDPGQSNGYFMLGRAYSFLKNTLKAEEAYTKGLSIRHKGGFGDIINDIKSSISVVGEDVEYGYRYVDGKLNYGLIKKNTTQRSVSTRVLELAKRLFIKAYDQSTLA